MKVHKYPNYEEYIKSQKKAYNKKINNVWANQGNIEFLSEYLKSRKTNIENGLCHGVRQGHEVQWFNKCFPESDIIGSELGGVLADNIIQWDFNKSNPDWIEKFDFIYSNSFDHSFDPIMTLNIWFHQLRHGGVIMLEYDRRQEHTGEISLPANATDPVSIKVDELVEKIPKWVPGAGVIDVLNMPVIKREFQKTIIMGAKELLK